MTATAPEETHSLVRARYREIARLGKPVPEADPSAPSPVEIARGIGYRDEDIRAVPEGANLGLGCGAPLVHAALQPGETVLDLGCGAGFDAFLAAREVGASGHVIGVDLCPELVERARANAETAGYRNVEFREGFIEALPVEDGSIDVVISNDVICLVPNKAAVFREVVRVLRPGGRVVVCDVVLDAPFPAAWAAGVAAMTGCVVEVAPRDDYLATVAASGLERVLVVKDEGFGEMELAMVPEKMVRVVEAAGVDLRAIARNFRSITLTAGKPSL